MAYCCLEIERSDQAVGEKIVEFLRREIEPILQGQFPSDIDIEAEILPASNWISFLEGFMAGACKLRV
jgi:hypothetical protein